MAEIVKEATIGNKLFIFLVCVSVGAFVASWIVPPTGVVDGSVLEGMGWLFALAGLDTVRHAIDRGIDARISKGDTTFSITNPDPQPVCERPIETKES